MRLHLRMSADACAYAYALAETSVLGNKTKEKTSRFRDE